MNIVGCILFVIAGIIAIKVSGVTKKQGLSDYSKCNTAIERLHIQKIVVGTDGMIWHLISVTI